MLVPLGPIQPNRQPSIPKRVLVFIVRSLLAPIFFIIGKVYKVCFGRLDESWARKNEREFAAEIETKFEFLFKEHDARIVPNEADVPLVPSLDGAYVTVVTDAVRFRFTRGRGDLLLEVAPLNAPTEWERLDLVLAVIPNLPSRSNRVIRRCCGLLPEFFPFFTSLGVTLCRKSELARP